MEAIVRTAVAVPAEQRTVLREVSWETYERLLAERGEQPVPLLSFDEGVLEIMSPGQRHEALGSLVTMLLGIVAEVWDTDVADLGSTTFRRAEWQRGFEPDVCLYVGAAAGEVLRSEEWDPHRDPAPDVVVEIDISRSSIGKLAMFAQFGVGEVWRHDGERMTVALLGDGAYQPASASRALPLLTADALTRLLASRTATTLPAWVREVRRWAHAAAEATR